MIVVIADDLSGAAELAGAALRHGLSAELQTSFNAASAAEVVCVDTDSRMLAPKDAAERATEVARRVVAAKPAWIFKKCDSVLRGPVLAEARAVAAVTERSRLLLVPANPSRERTISDGIYRIAGQPLHETAFARDPVHPRRTANVKELLGGDLAGVTVPDVTTADDVRLRAGCVDADVLPVGGVDFFAAMLAKQVPVGTPPPSPVRAKGSSLLVCGSATSWGQRRAEATAQGMPVFGEPHDISGAVAALRRGKSIVIGIGDGATTRNVPPATLTADLARTVAVIFGQVRLEALYLEGGATSAAVIAALGWTRLRAESGEHPGIGMLRPVGDDTPLVVIKPGSYPWPPALWP